jgi:hypothetical protein
MAETATEIDFDAPSFEESNTGFELIEPGFYRLRLTGIDDPVPQSAEFDKTGKKKRALFRFTVVGGEWDDYQITQWYNLSMNESSFLYPVVKSLMGGTVNPDTRPNRATLVGREMMATIGHTDKKPGDDRVWPTIQSTLPVRSIASSWQKKAEQGPVTDPIEFSDVPF